MKRVGDKIAKNTFNSDRDGVVQWSGAFGQMEYNSERWSYFVNVSGIVNGYRGIDYFKKRQLDLEDTTLYIGYSENGTNWEADSIEYNGTMYTVESEGLEYQKNKLEIFAWFHLKVRNWLQLGQELYGICKCGDSQSNSTILERYRQQYQFLLW
jgi:hypothetical protein